MHCKIFNWWKKLKFSQNEWKARIPLFPHLTDMSVRAVFVQNIHVVDVSLFSIICWSEYKVNVVHTMFNLGLFLPCRICPFCLLACFSLKQGNARDMGSGYILTCAKLVAVWQMSCLFCIALPSNWTTPLEQWKLSLQGDAKAHITQTFLLFWCMDLHKHGAWFMITHQHKELRSN